MNNYVNTLYQIRLLETQEECEEFDQLLEILDNEQNFDLKDLFMVFDENTLEEEVMFGLVHYVESFEAEDYLRSLLDSLINIPSHSIYWIEILLKRILNNDEYKKTLISILGSQDERIDFQLKSILQSVQEDNPARFSSPVDEVLTKLNGNLEK
ncbi:Imm30 family immunity protein [Paenibacillus wulumuqiensis]|uniref:Imm30 family immunity protein n=1 Tax=Paenibacillus wulumuqiensis TaxID=1567107 RepID=UPI000619188A|nr:Imm30 family immunity protein [Paenibacillus wulumuqiensis]